MRAPQEIPYCRAWTTGIGHKDLRAPCYPHLASGYLGVTSSNLVVSLKIPGEAFLEFPNHAEEAGFHRVLDFVEDLFRVHHLRL